VAPDGRSYTTFLETALRLDELLVAGQVLDARQAERGQEPLGGSVEERAADVVAAAGDRVEFGGLFGSATIMEVRNPGASDAFIRFGGRIPAPIQSMRN